MKKIILFLFIFCNCFSQSNKVCYNFDVIIQYDYINYSKNIKGEITELLSSKDSTYYLKKINLNNEYSSTLYDSKYNCLYKTDSLKTDTKNTSNLNAEIYTVIERENHNKKEIEEIRHEFDSIKNEYIVHKLVFKNSKKKKIIKETYFFFKPNNNLKSDHIPQVNEIIRKYNLSFLTNYKMVKIIHLYDGKKNSESDFKIINNNIEVINICLKIIDFFPKIDNTTTKAEIRYEEIRKSRQ